MQTQHSPTKKERGQSLVEVAISITFLLLMLGGVVDLGRALFTWIALRDAAQEGALFGSLAPYDMAGMEARVRVAASDPVDLSNPQRVTVDSKINGAACGGAGNSVTVSVTYDFDIMMPFMGTILGSQNVPITAKITHTILRPPCPKPPK